jgi:hypothetical protein
MKIVAIMIPFITRTTSLETKLCTNCKHIIVHPTNIKFSKCSLFPKQEDTSAFLVDGDNIFEPIDYMYCSVTRNYDHLCGKKGKLWENSTNITPTKKRNIKWRWGWMWIN